MIEFSEPAAAPRRKAPPRSSVPWTAPASSPAAATPCKRHARRVCPADHAFPIMTISSGVVPGSGTVYLVDQRAPADFEFADADDRG
ncbi:MAG: hypothetical protein KatS3mg038_2312 [Candidatus Kapaibacterium sp.]|nr:MAG: hypothetical protein KatS3mg038_2312 [Candidatus Kapabacteria bacterium]